MTVQRPLIAVTPLMDYGRDSLWMLPGYMDAVMRAGGTPVMLPLTDDPDIIAQCAQQFDAFLFTGGPDVGPDVGSGAGTGMSPVMGSDAGMDAEPGTGPTLAAPAKPEEASSAPSPDSPSHPTLPIPDRIPEDGSPAHVPSTTGRSEVLSPERDRVESRLLAEVMVADKPILGICRGIQFINKYLGGTLWQDLPTEHPSEIEHHMKPPYDAFGHTVSLTPGTPLADLFAGQSEIAVNSYHHQAVREPAPGLEVMATAPDGVIEAIWRPTSRFLWAVQWHPEFLYRVDPRSQAIFDSFVSAVYRCHFGRDTVRLHVDEAVSTLQG